MSKRQPVTASQDLFLRKKLHQHFLYLGVGNPSTCEGEDKKIRKSGSSLATQQVGGQLEQQLKLSRNKLFLK